MCKMAVHLGDCLKEDLGRRTSGWLLWDGCFSSMQMFHARGWTMAWWVGSSPANRATELEKMGMLDSARRWYFMTFDLLSSWAYSMVRDRLKLGDVHGSNWLSFQHSNTQTWVQPFQYNQVRSREAGAQNQWKNSEHIIKAMASSGCLESCLFCIRLHGKQRKWRTTAGRKMQLGIIIPSLSNIPFLL